MKQILSISAIITLLNFSAHAQNPKDYNPVLVEMFTSEGCSSCPPADKVMADLQKEYENQNKPVYFIASHVDYWNYLGWTDQFSSAENTKRQNTYANVFGTTSIYTPQAVVNGQKEMVGSKKQLLKQTIDLELVKKNPDKLKLTSVFHESKNSITVNYSFSGNHTEKEITFLLIEKSQTVKVLKGENRGESLHHINIVKQLITEKLKPSGTVELQIKEKITLSDFNFIAFVNNKVDKKVLAVEKAF